MLSRLDDSHERSIAPVELHYNEMLLPLRPVAGHTTPHCHIVRNSADRPKTKIRSKHAIDSCLAFHHAASSSMIGEKL
jgi:hypothetical protein